MKVICYCQFKKIENKCLEKGQRAKGQKNGNSRKDKKIHIKAI